MEYKIKYEKYKAKYLALQRKLNNVNQFGGSDNANHELYLFKAEWCGHCRKFKNDWETLQNSKLKNKINFITIDSEINQNEIKEWKIKGYPTLILKSNDKAIEYQGPRNIKEITKFINNNIN